MCTQQTEKITCARSAGSHYVGRDRSPSRLGWAQPGLVRHPDSRLPRWLCGYSSVVGSEKLQEYRRKRTGASGEPQGGVESNAGRAQLPRFVVQRHDASSLHFDFRLEVDGVLVSWAVPKGPSLDPGQKRLAARTEDHPLDYADFEGRIESGNYGAGTVIVWDHGTFENITERSGKPRNAATALAHGHLKVWLYGAKLSGAFALTRTRMGDDERNWLLIKVDDSGADRRRKPAKTQPESVLSDRVNGDL